MNLVELEKIGPSILNDLGYIGRLEKKSGSNRKKTKNLVKSTVTEDKNCNWD